MKEKKGAIDRESARSSEREREREREREGGREGENYCRAYFYYFLEIRTKT